MEDVDHSDTCATGCLGASVGLNTGRSSNTDPANGTTKVDPDEHRTTSNGINKHASNSSEENLDSVHDNKEMAPGGSILDACSFEDSSKEVRDNTYNKSVLRF